MEESRVHIQVSSYGNLDIERSRLRQKRLNVSKERTGNANLIMRHQTWNLRVIRNHYLNKP